MPMIDVDGEMVAGVCRRHRKHVPCRACDVEPKLDARSYVAGFRMGVAIGKQDAALETYASNILYSETLRRIDADDGSRWSPDEFLSDPDKPR